MALAPGRLEAAVASICPEIEARVNSTRAAPDEGRLWWELSCCLLSSQVPFPLATAAADAIQVSGLLTDLDRSIDETTEMLTVLLRRPFRVDGINRAYRFPNARARQLAETKAAVTHQSGSLQALMATFDHPFRAREWFVTMAPGLGPKQTSMFLRNAGISYDLAVLDRHVLRYMTALQLGGSLPLNISSLREYRRHEDTLRDHALHLGYPLGLLDWAIWIVMRNVNKRQMELPIK